MEQVLTIKARLYPSQEQRVSMLNTMEQYRLACNFVSQYYFDHDFDVKQRQLHDDLYYDLRQQFQLKAQMAESTIRTVIARYKTLKTQLLQKPYKFQDVNTKQWYLERRDLSWLQKPIKFRRPQVDLVSVRDWSILKNSQQLSINTIDKRIKLDFTAKGFEQLMTGKFGTAKLVFSKNHFYLHISSVIVTPDFDESVVQHVVGIDRGLRFLATTYDDAGHTDFYTGKAVMKKRTKFKQLRQQLQSKGTKSAKRRLKKIGQRETRWMTDVNHQVSKTLVTKYPTQTIFALEDLTNVRFATEKVSKTNQYEVSSWAFYQLETMLRYKAQRYGSRVVSVDAHYTSQRDPFTGEINKAFRNHHLHEFYNPSTGYHSNDDRIGAMNIQYLGTRYVSQLTDPDKDLQIISLIA